jgi:uncharacterized protein (TIGR00106 family)
MQTKNQVMIFNQVNMAIQVIPFTRGQNLYDVVDKAIEVIKKSGVTYRVCPFETVLEGKYDILVDLIKKVQEACFMNGAYEVITNIKIQARKDGNVTIEEKMYKYDLKKPGQGI